MTRDDKKHKLANAVKEYRGAYNETTKVWLLGRTSKPSAIVRVNRWLIELFTVHGFTDNAKVADALTLIETCNHWDKFNAWLKNL